MQGTFASAPPHQGLVSAFLPNQQNMLASVAGQASSVPGQQPTATSHDLLLRTHQQLAAAMVLPHAEVPTFKGDLLEFVPFMMAFETRSVPHTSRDSDRLYYLMQHILKVSQNISSMAAFTWNQRKDILRRLSDFIKCMETLMLFLQPISTS